MKLLIAGAGGHGRVVADAAECSGSFSEVAFADDHFAGMPNEGWRVVGKITELDRLREEYSYFVAAVGNADLRLKLLSVAEGLGYKLTNIIHPSATVSKYCHLGSGTVVTGGAVINVGCKLERGCIVNTTASVDHDCVLEEGVHVCPGAHLAGNVIIGKQTWFGIGAVAKQGIRIGCNVTVGAGAVVVNDIPDGATVMGNPARVHSR